LVVGLIQLDRVLVDDAQLHGRAARLVAFAVDRGRAVVNVLEIQPCIRGNEEILLAARVFERRDAVIPLAMFGQFGDVDGGIVDDDRRHASARKHHMVRRRHREFHVFFRQAGRSRRGKGMRRKGRSQTHARQQARIHHGSLPWMQSDF
jgi:hypothetical protein